MPRPPRAWVHPWLLLSLGIGACEQAADPSQRPGAVTPGLQASEAATSSAASSSARSLGSVIRFTDVTSATGIDMTLTSGRMPASEILEVKGGGLALIDFDNDGLDDLFIPNGATLQSPGAGPGCRLFRNEGNLTFRDVTADTGLSFNRWAFGVAVGDDNNDGYDDLYVACYGKNALLRNNGDGTFTEVTDQAGVGDEAWGTGCAWADLDGDGDLDLYVANFIEFDVNNPPARSMFKGVEVFAGPKGLAAASDVLYENMGDGTYRRITHEAGCDVPPQYGLNVVIVDFDGDGRPDIYVGNDSTPSFLFQNLGGMRFSEVGVRSGVAANGEGAFQATMGIAIGDVDGNGFPDLFTSNFSSDTNTLHMNLGRMLFDDRTTIYGLGSVSTPFLGWAAAFFDFNHDGAEDLIVFNGHVYPHATRATMDSEFLQPPLLFERKGKRFERVTTEATGEWVNKAYCDRSAVFGDLDGDGDIDIIVGELNGPVRVLRNDRNSAEGASHDTNWLMVELRDERQPLRNHRAIGSVVELTHGGLTQRRWVFSGGSFQSASSLDVHFGVPAGTKNVAVKVTWPDGFVSAHAQVSAGAMHRITRTDGGVEVIAVMTK